MTIGGSGIVASNTDGEATIKVLGVERTTDGGDYSDGPENGVFLLIDVSYECTDGTFNYNPFDWTVRDADGRTFDRSIYSGPATELHSGTIAKGAKARGVVVIDAPEGPVTVEYSSGWGAPATWAVP